MNAVVLKIPSILVSKDAATMNLSSPVDSGFFVIEMSLSCCTGSWPLCVSTLLLFSLSSVNMKIIVIVQRRKSNLFSDDTFLIDMQHAEMDAHFKNNPWEIIDISE